MSDTPTREVNDFELALLQRICSSRKYRDLALPEATVLDLIRHARSSHLGARSLEKAVKAKLHNLVAPYLGDPDYPKLQEKLAETADQIHQPYLQDLCLEVLGAHASTRERIPLLPDFYPRLFENTGVPATIIDLACGLNPFSLPWMGLPSSTRYFAYDLHLPRVEVINQLLAVLGQKGSAFHQDILISPPETRADVVFFFKEAHRFEQRQRGSTRVLLQSLDAHYVLLSLPVTNLTGRRDRRDQNRALVDQASRGLGFRITEIPFPNEMVYCLERDA